MSSQLRQISLTEYTWTRDVDGGRRGPLPEGATWCLMDCGATVQDSQLPEHLASECVADANTGMEW